MATRYFENAFWNSVRNHNVHAALVFAVYFAIAYAQNLCAQSAEPRILALLAALQAHERVRCIHGYIWDIIVEFSLVEYTRRPRFGAARINARGFGDAEQNDLNTALE